jgi:GNAT superfamily N-acetyltransferase
MEGVRPAEDGDLARCAELLAAARDAARTQRGGPMALSAPPWSSVPTGEGDGDDDLAVLGPWKSDGHDGVLLAGLYDGAVVGVGAGRVRVGGGANPERVGVIDCCYVEPGAREVGVGNALVTALVSWFSERGCTGVDAPALPGDRRTKQLFEAAGLSARLLVLHRRLP